MGLFRKSEKRAEELNEDNGAVLLSALIRGDSMSKAMALEIPAVSACVGLIADRIASLPLRLYDSSGGKVTEVDDDVRVGYINGDTGDTLSGSEMLKAWVADYFLTKGAYTYIYKNSYGKVLGLYYVRSEDVSINNNCKPIFKGYAICCDGATYLPHEFIKILRNSKGDGRGHSIIEENPLILSVAYNTISFENQLVKKGGNKKGFLKAKNRLTDAAMDKIKEAWKNLYSNNGENVIVLNDGMDFAESSNTSVEMQLNERKISTDTAICSLFGVPYDMLTGNASEAVKVRFFENAVMPVINAIEAALDRDLLLEGEKDHRYFAFDTREATRGDIQTRYNAYAVALQNNFMQLDEVRKLEDLEPLGVNYVKLGLNDVLLDPKTGRIYTPNTNAMVDMGTGSGAVMQSTEERAENGGDYSTRGPDGKFTGSVPRGGGGSASNNSEKQLTSGANSDTIKLKDIEIGRSLGAKAKNYDVMDLATGEVFQFSEGTKIQNAEVFAGKGSKVEFRNADKYAQRYGGQPKDWQHVKGYGTLDYYGEDRNAEVHWVQCQGFGKHEFFVKEWLE